MNEKILNGELSFRCVSQNVFLFGQKLYVTPRDGFRQDLESVAANGHTFEECKKILRESASVSWLVMITNLMRCLDITLDAGFKDFYKYCAENDIPITLVSRCMF